MSNLERCECHECTQARVAERQIRHLQAAMLHPPPQDVLKSDAALCCPECGHALRKHRVPGGKCDACVCVHNDDSRPASPSTPHAHSD